ncbi:helix-turn-helix domain-containing protein [Pseudorhodobacter sp. W20_MBD10_FR17]|uniref:MerR family transcriptional regulator n=1 Tax=Pseudorhodobacter sp. W20_MBD10_FR17 TaxID=3240266 RepID=UPI003F9B0E87
MLSIGKLAEQTGVKVPTIRYYESIGLLDEPGRNAGNQRRYGAAALERLAFIHHARALGFSLDDIRALIAMSAHPEQPCDAMNQIARDQLNATRARIAQLQRLEAELSRIVTECNADDGAVGACSVLAALGDHGKCAGPHSGPAPSALPVKSTQ